MSEFPASRKGKKRVLGTARDEQAIEELRRRGVDIEFVEWLEGAERKLPDFHAAYELSDKEIAGAIRALAILRDELRQAGATGDEQEFELLEVFLWNIAKHSAHPSTRTKDLAHLSAVLDTVLPPTIAASFKKVIERIRKPQIPDSAWTRTGNGRGRGGWGRREDEQTNRMRAAIAYLSKSTEQPYAALARIWNHFGGDYHPDEIFGRLRKGHLLDRAMAREILDHWEHVYRGDAGHVFVGPFPIGLKRERAARNKPSATLKKPL